MVDAVATDNGKARIIIEGWPVPRAAEPKTLFGATIHDVAQVALDKVRQEAQIQINVLDGAAREFELLIEGEPRIREVTGAISDWSVRQGTNGTRFLVLRTEKPISFRQNFSVVVKSETQSEVTGRAVRLLTFSTQSEALFSGYLRIESIGAAQAKIESTVGVTPVENCFLPMAIRGAGTNGTSSVAYRFQGERYAVTVKAEAADPEARQVVLRDYQLDGVVTGESGRFELSATAHVASPEGGTLELLSGPVALTDLTMHEGWQLQYIDGRYLAVFQKPGDYAVKLKFDSAIAKTQRPDGLWRNLQFRIATAAIAPVTLRGLERDARVEDSNAGKATLTNGIAQAYVSASGAVALAWRAGDEGASGKLFFSVDTTAQITIGPGLMRQAMIASIRPMQGELPSMDFVLRGQGEVTRVQGEHILSWTVLPGTNSDERILSIRFNQSVRDAFFVQIFSQTPLGSMPAAVSPVSLQARGATRTSGYVRIVNEGAVRLEVTAATGLTQLSPELFPETELTKSVFRQGGNQRFVYRSSSAEPVLTVRADPVSAELFVSEVLTYRVAETELSVEAELEVDVREAPLRELNISVPAGFALARLSAAGVSDHFLASGPTTNTSQLRLVFASPATNRQLVQLRLEQNRPWTNADWELPRIEVVGAKSARGHIGVVADAGLRIFPKRTANVTEVATAFFPRKTSGLQSAFRLSESDWQISISVERLPQSIQADAMHLFSIGEGIAYGSSVINYNISGSPVTMFKVELANEYFNVEFSGKEVRSWQVTNGVFLVQLHNPVSGAYSLLASYERPFKARGEALTFSGARPLDAQSEQGHTLIVSAYQFKVEAQEVSPGLLPLETAEVPPEYRMFFDAPLLAAYHYTTRPFVLRLALSPMAQGDSLNQVADRASLTTRISQEGQVITDARYFIKNRGNPQLRVFIPAGSELWSVQVDGKRAVPALEGKASVVPLPQTKDPNALITVDLKLTSRPKSARRVNVSTPSIDAPVLLADWKLEPDAGHRLEFLRGTLTPVPASADHSGYQQILDSFRGLGATGMLLAGSIVLWMLAAALWATSLGRQRVMRRSALWANVLCGCLCAALGLAGLAAAGMDFLGSRSAEASTNLAFRAPVQQAGGSLQVEVENTRVGKPGMAAVVASWPAVLAVLCWAWAWRRRQYSSHKLWRAAGWFTALWAALRAPGGGFATVCLMIAFLLVEIAWPALREFWGSKSYRVAQDAVAATTPSAGGMAGLLLLLSCIGAANAHSAQLTNQPIATSLHQDIRVEGDSILSQATLRWQAERGQLLTLLSAPAVLMRVELNHEGFRLVRATVGEQPVVQVMAQTNGLLSATFSYQLRTVSREGQQGFSLPTGMALMNTATITITREDVHITASNAASIERERKSSNTVARLALQPQAGQWIGWSPRPRDPGEEKALFYADVSQVFTPASGLIEGVHLVLIRPAQGQLADLRVRVPEGTAILDVRGIAGPPNSSPAPQQIRVEDVTISQWRYDPEAGMLRIVLNSPQSKPFSVLVRSQFPASSLPFSHNARLMSVEGAAGQVGYAALATGPDVQIEAASPSALTPLNLEDFPPEAMAALSASVPGAVIRRAFRYSNPAGVLEFRAAAVEPDVRVETQQTVSISADRVVLAANATVNITRAGVFKLSFIVPLGLGVESISSSAMTHWTESRSNGLQIVTIHLKGKTEGQHAINATLSGGAVGTNTNWVLPQFAIREAVKQSGILIVAPEQGLRVQPVDREFVTQLDPQRSGISQKDALVFRVLQHPWRLVTSIEQVEPWVQCNVFEHAHISEAQMRVTANLQYSIENAGVRQVRVKLPANALNVRFTGEQVADYAPLGQGSTNAYQLWEIKLHRRVIGAWLLVTDFHVNMAQGTSQANIRGIVADGVNSQRGFLAIRTGPRLQASPSQLPIELQPAEWQSIPATLLSGIADESANATFRVVEPAYLLPLKLERREVSKLLPARVNRITMESVVADDAAMLTRVLLEIVPGDKRLLNLTLPPEGKFWFAFVNQNGVWPWRDGEKILIPLEQQSRPEQAISVEFFYTVRAGKPQGRKLDIAFAAPKFDLPLENITWRLIMHEKWKLERWSGALELKPVVERVRYSSAGLEDYLKDEVAWRNEQTKEAEQLLTLGNNALIQGDAQQARRAFQSAFGLSRHELAFNEDARVQLQNVKVQQALLGLNYRNLANGAAVSNSMAGAVNSQNVLNLTPDSAKRLLEQNSADENAALTRQAERIIQQQDAAISTPAGIRANIPQEGRVLTFTRTVAIDTWAELPLRVRAEASGGNRPVAKLGILLLAAACIGGFVFAGGMFNRWKTTGKIA